MNEKVEDTLETIFKWIYFALAVVSLVALGMLLIRAIRLTF